MGQRISEWCDDQYRSNEYHKAQYVKPYRSTEVFVDWIDEKIENSVTVCDMACGGGANLHYLSRKYSNVNFVGIDVAQSNIDMAKSMLSDLKNVNVALGDLYNLPIIHKNKYSGIIMFQTLSWLPEYKQAIKCLTDLNPDWIAMSSLFYNGNIEYNIQIEDYTRVDRNNNCMNAFYNIYSLPRVKEYFRQLGYTNFEFTKFDIDIDIEKTVDDGLGTYTKKMEDGSRIQISAGLMLPWYFIIASK